MSGSLNRLRVDLYEGKRLGAPVLKVRCGWRMPTGKPCGADTGLEVLLIKPFGEVLAGMMFGRTGAPVPAEFKGRDEDIPPDVRPMVEELRERQAELFERHRRETGERYVAREHIAEALRHPHCRPSWWGTCSKGHPLMFQRDRLLAAVRRTPRRDWPGVWLVPVHWEDGLRDLERDGVPNP